MYPTYAVYIHGAPIKNICLAPQNEEQGVLDSVIVHSVRGLKGDTLTLALFIVHSARGLKGRFAGVAGRSRSADTGVFRQDQLLR